MAQYHLGEVGVYNVLAYSMYTFYLFRRFCLPFLSFGPPTGLHSLLNIVTGRKSWLRSMTSFMLLYISNLDQKAEFSIFELQKAREEMDGWRSVFGVMKVEAEVDFNLIRCSTRGRCRSNPRAQRGESGFSPQACEPHKGEGEVGCSLASNR